jgi:polysaccharide pyruvyl transferase WcaK-like protein
LPTALLAGAFGQGNLGDEALLQAFARALPDWRMVATTSDPEGGAAPELVEFEGVPSRRPLAVAGKAMSSDAVIVGGGTIFKLLDASGRRPRGLLANASALVGAASMCRRPVAMVGVGAGRIHGSVATAYVRFLVRHSDLLILRDEESAGRLSAAGAVGPFRVGADPAWTLLDPPGSAITHHTRRVLVVPSVDAATSVGGRRALIELLVVALQMVKAAGNEVWLQAWQHGRTGDDDVAVVAELADRLGNDVDVVTTPGSLPEAMEQMRAFGAVLCFRFHALIAAGAAGIPSVAIAHEPKLAGLARRLEQTALAPAVSAQRLAETLCGIVDGAGPSPAVVKEEIARAEEGFRLLRVFLAGGTDESDHLGALPLVSWPS